MCQFLKIHRIDANFKAALCQLLNIHRTVQQEQIKVKSIICHQFTPVWIKIFSDGGVWQLAHRLHISAVAVSQRKSGRGSASGMVQVSTLHYSLPSQKNAI